jgi:hypothetical protein
VTLLWTNATSQDSRIVALEGVDTNLWSNATAQETHITNLWVNATNQDALITTLFTNASEQSGRLVYLDSNATLQDARIVALEGSLTDYLPLAGGTMTGDLLTTWVNVSVGVSLLDNDIICYGSSCDVCEYFNGTHQVKESPCGV